MNHKVINSSLVVAIVASMAGFPFEPLGAHNWAGFFFVAWALALFTASGLLALAAIRAQNDLAAVGFGAVALYGLGTTLNSSLLARGLAEMSVGIQPGIWAMLALGLVLIGFSNRFSGWVTIVGLLAAVAHFVASVAVLFGAEMPHTGAVASDWAPLVVAVGKLLLWATMIGWILVLRREAIRKEGVIDHERFTGS
jgi:hypothetical protein